MQKISEARRAIKAYGALIEAMRDLPETARDENFDAQLETANNNLDIWEDDLKKLEKEAGE